MSFWPRLSRRCLFLPAPPRGPAAGSPPQASHRRALIFLGNTEAHPLTCPCSPGPLRAGASWNRPTPAPLLSGSHTPAPTPWPGPWSHWPCLQGDAGGPCHAGWSALAKAGGPCSPQWTGASVQAVPSARQTKVGPQAVGAAGARAFFIRRPAALRGLLGLQTHLSSQVLEVRPDPGLVGLQFPPWSLVRESVSQPFELPGAVSLDSTALRRHSS